MHGDTATSPETVKYQSPDLPAGTWNLQVCPFPGGVVAAPYSYTGTFATSNVPVTQVETTPGSGTGGAGGTPTPTYVAGKLTFSPATVVDPQRTEGEPLNFLDPKTNDYWESGPFGTTSQNSWIHRSTDNGLEFHVDSPVGLRPDAPPGGGDTDIAVDDQGYHYFVDLEGLVNLGTSVSNDDGKRGGRTRWPSRTWPSTGNGSPWTTARRPRPPTTRSSWVPRDGRRHVHLLEPRHDRLDRPGRRARLAERFREGAAPAGRGRDLRPAALRPEVPQPVLRLQRGRSRALDDRPRGARPANGDPVPQRDAPGLAGRRRPGASLPGSGGRLRRQRLRGLDRRQRQRRLLLVLGRPGREWTTPVRVSTAPSTTAEFLWAQAGAAGNLALAWYATDTAGQPDSFPNWATDPQGATTVKWWGYAATISNAASLSPTIAQERFTEKPMHYGQICNQGIGCTVSSGDRTMADYFALNLDKTGSIRIVYNDTTSQSHGAHLYEARQLDGKTVTGKRASDRVPKSPMKDVTGDAQWPHYSPTGAGPEPTAARPDERRVEHGQPEHAAGEDDGRRPGRDAPARREDERRLADALPGAVGRRFRRGGLPDLLRRGRVDRGHGTEVLRGLDDLHRHDARELQGRRLPGNHEPRPAASAGTRSPSTCRSTAASGSACRSATRSTT